MSGGVQAQDDFGAGGLFETQPLGANRDPPVGPDLDGGTDAPDVVPPRAAGSGALDGTLFAVGLPPRLLWRLAQFAMDLMGVVVGTQGVEVGVGNGQIGDLFAGEGGGGRPCQYWCSRSTLPLAWGVGA